MINVDKILGAMVQSVVSGSLSTVVSKKSARRIAQKAGRAATRVDKKALGVGALGIAIAAYEHFTGGAQPSTNQHAAATTSGHPTPPPPPPAAPRAAAHDTAALEGSPEALVLLRTMVAAANADGAIDVEERQAIVAALADAGLSGDESAFIDTELSRPQRIESLAPEIRSRGLAEQAFTVALLAIDVDTDAERAFLERFQELVQLDDDTVRRISASTR